MSPTLGNCIKVQEGLENGDLVAKQKLVNPPEPNFREEHLSGSPSVVANFGFGGVHSAQPVVSSTYCLKFGLFADPGSCWLPTCMTAQEPNTIRGIYDCFDATAMPCSTAKATGAGGNPALRVRFLPVKSGRKVVLVRWEEIDWLIAEHNYIRLRVGRESYRVRGTLEAIERLLPADEFVRISRSRLVQLSRVQELELLTSRDCRLTLRDGTKMTLSRRYRPNFERLGIL